MAFQTPITVTEAVEEIHRKKYLLPAIQREVVWEAEQIEKLFDSLMRDYPIGSFLYWYVTKDKTGNYQFYEFVRDYHEKKSRHNPKANVSGQDDIIGILDGQQRLTSLYIGLRGTYAYKEPRKRWDNPDAFPKRRLYLNLLSPRNDPQSDMLFNFDFKSDEEVAQSDGEAFWYKVGDVLKIEDLSGINDFLLEKSLMTGVPKEMARFANKTLHKLW